MKYIILKTVTLEAMYSSWNSIDIELFVSQDLNDGKYPLIVGDEGLTKFGSGIGQYKYVIFIILGWVYLSKVNMQQVKCV